MTTGSDTMVAGQYRHPRTGQPAAVRAFAEGLTVNTCTGYRRVGADAYRSEDGTRRLQLRRHAGGVQGYWLVPSTGDSLFFERAAEWTPPAEELGAVAGCYRSTDADASWTIERRRDG